MPILLVGSAAAQSRARWQDPSPHTTRLVAVEADYQVEVLDWGGNGRPLVLLAGAGHTAHVFDDFAQRLTAYGRVYGMTRRGYGASSAPSSGYRASRLGEDVVQVLHALELQQPVLIGHSLAGRELSYVASAHAGRIAGAIYLDAAYRYAFDWPGARDNLLDLPPPPNKQFEAGGEPFTRLTVPALAIFASPHALVSAATRDAGPRAAFEAFERFDEAMTERQAAAFERGVPGSRVVRLRHATHYLFLSHEAEVLGEIRAFLARLALAMESGALRPDRHRGRVGRVRIPPPRAAGAGGWQGQADRERGTGAAA